MKTLNLKQLNLLFTVTAVGLIGCDGPKVRAPNHYDGKDVRTEFLKTQSGEYESTLYTKSDGGKLYVNIDSNGRFERPSTGTFSSPETRGYSLRCVATHKGQVTYAQEMEESKKRGNIQIGEMTFSASTTAERNFYLVLDSDEVEVESSNLTTWDNAKKKDQIVEGQDAILSPETRKSMCASQFRRHVIFLKDFAPGYLREADSSSIFIDKNSEWIWFEKPATKDLVAKFQSRMQDPSFRSRYSTLSIGGETVATGTTSTFAWSPIFDLSTNEDFFVLKVLFDNLSSGVPLVELRGRLLGSSFNAKTGDLIIKLSDNEFVSAPEESLSLATASRELSHTVAKFRQDLKNKISKSLIEGRENSEIEVRLKDGLRWSVSTELDIRPSVVSK